MVHFYTGDSVFSYVLLCLLSICFLSLQIAYEAYAGPPSSERRQEGLLQEECFGGNEGGANFSQGKTWFVNLHTRVTHTPAPKKRNPFLVIINRVIKFYCFKAR